jgi:hypothetical protein
MITMMMMMMIVAVSKSDVVAVSMTMHDVSLRQRHHSSRVVVLQL